MSGYEGLQDRVSAPPWSLYRSPSLAELQSGHERDGFYVSMLKDDLRQAVLRLRRLTRSEGSGVERCRPMHSSLS